MGIAAIILAGGQSSRMNQPQGEPSREPHADLSNKSIDKASLQLGGKALIEHSIACLAQQDNLTTDEFYISADHDFDTGFDFIPDHEDGPPGPAGGIYAAWRFFQTLENPPAGLITLPVDSPFLPTDLTSRLCPSQSMHYCATRSEDKINHHRACAYWPLSVLQENWLHFLNQSAPKKDWSLRHLIALCDGQPIFWEDRHLFFNVNTPEDFEAATQLFQERLKPIQ